MNNNAKVGNAVRNVGALLDRHIKEEESRASLGESASSDKLNNGINGELILIYFLLFVLMLTIACFVLGVFLKNRRGKNSKGEAMSATRNIKAATNVRYSNR